MRQAGYKPKSHNSGVYWTRVSGNKKNKSKKNIRLPPKDFNPWLKLAAGLIIVGLVILALKP